MIYIFTAFYWEAQVLIGQFHLKKVLESKHFQQFADEACQILLTISGAGEVAAAAAVGSVCTGYLPGKKDVLLNFGICAGDAEKGSIFLIRKLTEQATGKTFYPDLLYRHPFPEAELVTCMLPWKRGQEHGTGQRKDGCVYDMEGAAVYQAGACYFAPHQMVFLKLVSDHGEGMPLSGQFVRQLLRTQQESLAAFICQLLQISGQRQEGWKEHSEAGRRAGVELQLASGRKAGAELQLASGRKVGADLRAEAGSVLEMEIDSEEMRRWAGRLCVDLHASKTMEAQIRQLIRYAVLTGTDCRAAVERMYQQNRLPCRDKREGKQRFEELKQQLL